MCARALGRVQARGGAGGSKTLHVPCFGHRWNTAPAMLWPLGRSKKLLGPARICRGARMGRLSPRSVPPERSKGLLKPLLGSSKRSKGPLELPFGAPERSKGLLKPQLSAPCACSLSLLGAPFTLRAAFRGPAGCCRKPSSYLLCQWVLEKALENAV